MLAPSLWAGATSSILIIAAASHCRPVSHYARISRPIPFRFCNLYLLAIPTGHSWLRMSTHRPPAPILYITDNVLAPTIITCANSAVIIRNLSPNHPHKHNCNGPRYNHFYSGLDDFICLPTSRRGHAVISVVVDEYSNPATQLISATPRSIASLSPSVPIGQPIPTSLGFQLSACA